MKEIVVWNNVVMPKPTEAIKRSSTSQHVLHTPKGAYVLNKKTDEWKLVRGASNVADLIRAAHKATTTKPVVKATPPTKVTAKSTTKVAAKPPTKVAAKPKRPIVNKKVVAQKKKVIAGKQKAG